MDAPAKRPAGFTLLEILILAAIVAVIAAIVVPNYISARRTPCANACVNNLRQIDAAKQQWALRGCPKTFLSTNQEDNQILRKVCATRFFSNRQLIGTSSWTPAN